jgi:hypothetical protein
LINPQFCHVLSAFRKESHLANSRFPKIFAGNDFFFLGGCSWCVLMLGEETERWIGSLTQFPCASRTCKKKKLKKKCELGRADGVDKGMAQEGAKKDIKKRREKRE